MHTERDISNGAGTLAYARKPQRRHGSTSCDRHGRMEQADAHAIEIDLNGTTWAFDGRAPFADEDGVELWYCPECIDDKLRTYDRGDAADLTLLVEAIGEKWTNPHRRGQMDRQLFRAVEVDPDAADPLFCPYCADHVEQADDAVECSVHGRLTVHVETREEPPTP